MKQKISGLIITHNEEKNIREVLGCFHFCDEIIVVDSFSTDKTVEIAQSFPGVKVVQHAFENFSKQRNKALSYASHDWVLFLDADERILPNLEEEILQTIHHNKSKDAYYFYRLFFFNGKPIRFSGTQNDKNFRLFRKSKAYYTEDKLVHETLKVDGEIDCLNNKLLHYSFDDYPSYKNKMIHYGELKAQELFLKGKKYSAFTKWIKTSFKFLKSYVFRLGFLDGKNGFYLCYLQSLSTYITYSRFKKKQL